MARDAQSGRDDRLGAALRRLEVPEHRPGFGAELRARLAQLVAEQEAVSRRQRHPRRRGPLRPPVRHSVRWGLSAVAAAAAVAVGFFLVVGNLPGTPPQTATAAEVRAAVFQGWSDVDTVAGELLVETEDLIQGRGEMRWTFMATARGDVREIGITREEDLAYDADRHVQRTFAVLENGEVIGGVGRGLAPGGPDPTGTSAPLSRSLGAVVRALAETEGGQVQDTTYEGREAWLLDVDVRQSAIEPSLSPRHLQITVDKATGLPVRVVGTIAGRFVEETRIEGLRVNEPLPADAFTIEFPPGAEVHRNDYGFREVELDEVSSVVGYEPLVPSFVPEGYELADVMVSRKPTFTGTEGFNPMVGDIVSIAYRRGLDKLMVTLRPVGDNRSKWIDPLGTGEGFEDRPERLELSEGALAGRKAELMIDPLVIPHLWTMTDDLVVTVSGELTRAELIRVAESLGQAVHDGTP